MSLEISKYNTLLLNKWIIPVGEGRHIFNQDFLKLMDLFDSIILQWAKEDQAEIYSYPDFISINKIEKCNYIRQFHNNCFFACRSNTDSFNGSQLEATDYISNPSLCMHSYIQFEDTCINQPIVLTTKGKCKRNETKEYTTLSRLLDFTMRETVFIGPEKYVLNKRNEYMERARQLIEELKLEGDIKLANDPFFKKEDGTKSDYQRKFKLKYEINMVNKDDDSEIAVGSFNYHGIHFSKAFNIRTQNNKYAFTACMAFGLERLAYAFITQVDLENCITILGDYIKKKYEKP